MGLKNIKIENQAFSKEQGKEDIRDKEKQRDEELRQKGLVEVKKRESKFKNLGNNEIKAKLKESKEELFNLRFSGAMGNLEKPSRLRELRHQVARLKTVLKEREKEAKVD